MRWKFRQSSGEISNPDGDVIAVGYSGHGEGKNNPAMQADVDVGPIPVGLYLICAPRDSERTGKFVLDLIPNPETETFGRSDFEWHGDLIKHPGAGLASHGCIISDRHTRELVAASNDKELEVIA